MNALCRKKLLSFKDEAERDLNILIDCILNSNKAIGELQLTDLKIEPLERGVNEVVVTRDAIEPSDFRIRSLELYNFRTFPGTTKPYGIAFTKDGCEPCSLFLVGRNGTGKSTIFDALEWIYAGKATNAEQRGIETREETEAYLTYGFGKLEGITSNEVKLKVRLKDNRILGDNWIKPFETRPLCVPALCCSDLDIERIAKYDDGEETTNYHHFISSQLGYEELTLLQKKLEEFASELTRQGDIIRRRIELSDLTSGDINMIRRQLAKTLLSPRWRSKEQMDLALKFADKTEIEKIKTETHPESFKEGQPVEFRRAWDDLIGNVKMLQAVSAEAGVAGYQDTIDTTESPTNIYESRINSQIVKLAAIYKRYKRAWEEYNKDSEKHHEGLDKAMANLKSDYDFLAGLNHTQIPEQRSRLVAISAEQQSVGRAVAKLIKKLDTAIGHLFEKEELQDGGDAVFTNIYPSQLTEFIRNILNNFKELNEEFVVNRKANSFQVSIRVTTNNNHQFSTSPRKYLNTFRFRLYAVMLKISLALYYMESNECVAPIIIDDVFNASDFENSVSLSAFVSKIYEVYQEVINSDKPLQLIILTHDEMMANSFQRGVKMKSAKMIDKIKSGAKSDPERYFIQARLFHYTDAKEVEKTRGIGPFMNLYLPICS